MQKKGLITGTASEQTGSTLNAQSVELIFRTFARRFAHRWTISFEDRLARQLWLRDLKHERITDSDVVKGLNACILCQWPPSIGQFINYCKRKEYDALYHRPYKALPRPSVNPEAVEKNISKMKALLK